MHLSCAAAGPRLLRRAMPWLVAVVAAGCTGDDPDARYATYLARLSRTLSLPAPAVQETPLPRLPRSGTLALATPGNSLDTLDFLALSGCALQVTIGRRNSSLGRLARPSQRLLLELEYLRLAPDCARQLRERGKESLAATLDQAWELKRRQLPAFIYNATLAGEEYRAFWLPARRTGSYPPSAATTVPDALKRINHHARRWLGGDYTAVNRDVETLLSEVAGGSGGALFKALSRQHDWLATADGLLQQRMARGPLCGPHTRYPAADILPGVIRRFFIDGIQTTAAQRARDLYTVLPAVKELEALLAPVLPSAYSEWQTARDARLAAAGDAPRRHAETLQRILAPCGGMH